MPDAHDAWREIAGLPRPYDQDAAAEVARAVDDADVTVQVKPLDRLYTREDPMAQPRRAREPIASWVLVPLVIVQGVLAALIWSGTLDVETADRIWTVVGQAATTLVPATGVLVARRSVWSPAGAQRAGLPDPRQTPRGGSGAAPGGDGG